MMRHFSLRKVNSMIRFSPKPSSLFAFLAALSPSLLSAQTPGLTANKLTIKSFLDFGHVISGFNQYGNEKTGDQDISALPLNRMNVMAIQDIAVERFDISVGLSALVWWPYDGGLSTDLKQRLVNVKPMVPVARARWQFGSPETVAGSVQVGTFNYKYNPDAKNLGEYLYRSGTYPGFLWSNDGWLLMNRAGAYSHGLLATLAQFNGTLKHNLSLFMETQYSPVGDFSPGYDFSYTTKWLDLGGGAVLNHYLPIRPSALKPKNEANSYVRVMDSVTNAGGGIDTRIYYAPKSEVANLQLQHATDPEEISRWTSKGVKVMGRAALNLGNLIPDELRSPEDGRVFAEVALLGVENQPLFYEKRSQRMPLMLGVNIPTGKLLDLLCLQVEYYKSPYNDIDYFNAQSLPVWKTTFAKDSTDKYLTDAGGKVIPMAITKDDLKWSVYAKRIVNKSITVYAQAASDHFRLTDADYRVTPVPLTTKPSQWYYLLRMEFAVR
jgi:hypothetical protein